MALIDDLTKHIQERKDSVFNLKIWWDEIVNRFEEICFLGEIDNDVLYVTMLHQVVTCDGQLINVSIDEANEFYIYGNIRKLVDWRPFAWTFWRINLETGYISVSTSFNGSKLKSPKDNYGLSYEQVKLFEGQQLTFEADIENLSFRDKRVFEKLIDIINYSKQNEIDFADFDKKVHQNMVEYFGIINNKGFLEDEHVNTGRPELIKLPQNHTPVRIDLDVPMVNKLKGMSFNEIDYKNNAEFREFNNTKELTDYMYSLLDFINKNNLPLNLSQQITEISKHWESNKWPMPKMTEDKEKDKEDVLENRTIYTKYEIVVTKFLNKVFFRADVWEYGLCYYYTNQ